MHVALYVHIHSVMHNATFWFTQYDRPAYEGILHLIDSRGCDLKLCIIHSWKYDLFFVSFLNINIELEE